METSNMAESVDKIKTRVIGIDIRVDRTTYAVVDIRGEIVAQDYFLTTDFIDINDFISALSEKVIALAEENGGYETIRSIGVSAPSASSVTGCIENAANLPWKGVVPLAAMLRDRIGLAVAVANDAHITREIVWQRTWYERLCGSFDKSWRTRQLLLLKRSATSGIQRICRRAGTYLC